MRPLTAQATALAHPIFILQLTSSPKRWSTTVSRPASRRTSLSIRRSMNQRSLKLFMAVATLAPLAGAAGCIVEEHPRVGVVVVHDEPIREREVIVEEAPPPERIEVETVRPSERHIWIKGHWYRAGNHWQWANGHWEERPHAHAEFEHGHWEHRGHGY